MTIKIRVWDKVTKFWLKKYTLHPTDDGLAVSSQGVWCTGDVEVSQFTGLHDKNGKEIYEADIIRIEDDYADVSTVHTVEYGVGYGYPAFKFSPQLECECNGFSYVIQGGEATIEVIGNIYENPELLEQDND